MVDSILELFNLLAETETFFENVLCLISDILYIQRLLLVHTKLTSLDTLAEKTKMTTITVDEYVFYLVIYEFENNIRLKIKILVPSEKKKRKLVSADL